MKSKQKLFIELLNNHKKLLRCPHCHEVLNVVNQSLECEQGHNYNISKKGTVTLIKGSHLKKDEVYTKDLFEARRQFINAGFYDDIHTVLRQYVSQGDVWCDMGSGEVSHGFAMVENQNTTMVALDLSKPAIEMGSDGIQLGVLPIVADLANMPMGNHSVNGILNFLSPSNESEMARILQDQGLILKVVPGTEYLKELRDALSMDPFEPTDYHFKHFDLVEEHHLINTKSLSESDFKHLVAMTPLSQYQKIKHNIDVITIDLRVLVLRKKGIS